MGGFAQDQGQRALDRGQWRAQLMTDGGDKLTLHPFYAFAVSDIAHHGNKFILAIVTEFGNQELDRRCYVNLRIRAVVVHCPPGRIGGIR